jgi:membrane protein
MQTKDLWPLAKQSSSEWMEDKASRLAASLAYYTMLSIAPLLIISIKIIGLIFGAEAARGGIEHYLSQNVGAKGAAAAEEMIKNAGQHGAGTLATIISTIILVMSASGVFGELQDALNTVWEVKPKPDRNWKDIVRERFFSFALVLGVVFLLMVSLVINTALSALTHVLNGQAVVWQIINFVVSIGVITCLFALIFRYLPDAKVKWRDVWLGAIVTGVLFTIGKFALSFYLGRASTTSVYGAAGSLVALLIWVYYSGQILFFGAEFTQVYAKFYDTGIKPAANALPMTEQDRAQVGAPHDQTIKAAARGHYPPSKVAIAAVPVLKKRIHRLSQRATESQRQRWSFGGTGLLLGAMAGAAATYLAKRDLISLRRCADDADLEVRMKKVQAQLRKIRSAEYGQQKKTVTDEFATIRQTLFAHKAAKRGLSGLLTNRLIEVFRRGLRSYHHA